MDASPEPLKTIPALSPEEERALTVPLSSGDAAYKETKQLSSGLSKEDIEHRAANNEHNRNEKFKDHFELIAIAGLYLIALLFAVVGFTWLFHLLTPDNWHYLSQEQVAKVQNIVTGGILTSIAANHVKKRIG